VLTTGRPCKFQVPTRDVDGVPSLLGFYAASVMLLVAAASKWHIYRYKLPQKEIKIFRIYWGKRDLHTYVLLE
jgi:hypothetical protein